MIRVLAAPVLVFTFVLVWSFNASLPHWCAHPEGNGNWIVQPLCK